MTDKRSDHDSGNDKQSEESSDDEVIIGDADDTKDTVAHDTQMRCSPSFLQENTQVCVETDVIRPMEGTQLRSVQQTATQATGQASEPELKRAVSQALQDFVHSGARLRGGQSRRGEKVAVQEYLGDVCGEDRQR